MGHQRLTEDVVEQLAAVLVRMESVVDIWVQSGVDVSESALMVSSRSPKGEETKFHTGSKAHDRASRRSGHHPREGQ